MFKIRRFRHWGGGKKNQMGLPKRPDWDHESAGGAPGKERANSRKCKVQELGGGEKASEVEKSRKRCSKILTLKPSKGGGEGGYLAGAGILLKKKGETIREVNRLKGYSEA